MQGILKKLVVEPWLYCSRRLTYAVLAKKLVRNGVMKPSCPVQGKHLLYVAASCLPHHISGYTTRTQAVIAALQKAGARVSVLTRPGYPWDRADRLVPGFTAEATARDTVNYHHLPYPLNNRPVVMYALQGARKVAAYAQAQRVAAIQAASNHVSALPALLAARKLEIPFFYEMRGLWELTRISRQPGFFNTESYQQGLQLEALVARSADRVFVISEALGRYVVDNFGVNPENISLLPNCVDVENFPETDISQIEPFVLGYAGSLIEYEGLDVLIKAIAGIKNTELPVCLRIIGEGEARSSLEALVQKLALQDRVVFSGRRSPAEAHQLLQRCAVVCIPRKAYEVCKIVTPIKLVEALAMGKPVIVPDLPVFREELGDEPAGWFFEAGNVSDLARVICEALASFPRQEALAEKARRHVAGHRDWQSYVKSIVEGIPA